MAAPESATDHAHAHPFRFTGSGNEYFRIWIVNLLLTLLSFGIYSAWAKVRREQYFHRHTRLDDSSFDYHGKPWAILKGRLIAWGLLILLATINDLAPQWYLLALLVASPLLPWLVLRSFVFRARNTSYRGLRFDFTGSYRQAARVVLGWGALTLLSLGLLFPVFMQRLKAFQFDHLRYGGQRFAMEADVRGFYGAVFLVSLVVLIPLLAMLALIAVAVVLAGDGNINDGAAGYVTLAAIWMFGFAAVATQLLVRPLWQVRLANLVWNRTRLGDYRFASGQAMTSLFPIFISNWLLILLTLGLYLPWAKVRMARYRAGHLHLLADTSLDHFIGAASQQPQAAGEEMADAFDLDIAL